MESGKRSDHYVFFGEFNGVKIWHNANIDISKQTREQKEVIKHIEIKNYQKWEPYYKPRLKKPETKTIYTIDN